MLGRRTFLIAILVALVAGAAGGGVAPPHLRADEREDRYEILIDLEADANRLDALESQANAERRVGLAVQAEVSELLVDMEHELVDLTGRGSAGAASVLELFQDYSPQIEEEFALMRAREFNRANVIDRRV